jgi:hypothetical protein
MFDEIGLDEMSAAGDEQVVGAIGAWARDEAAAAAHRLAAIGELVARRCPQELDPDLVDERSRWICDPWDATAAEVAAELGISARRASSQMYLAQSLRERLPKVNALFVEGRIGARLVSTISWRTHCVVGSAEMAAIDAEIAESAERWGPLSDRKTETLIDVVVAAHDPRACEWFTAAARGMDVQFGKRDDESGTRSVWGRLFSTHAELIERRLTAIARGVCDADPRSVGQRRAEAVGAVFAGADRIACHCGSPNCPNPTSQALKNAVVIHVVADQNAVDGARSRPVKESRRTPVALTANGGVVPNQLLAELIRDGAQVVPLATPCDGEEPRYRPSVRLQRFVRCRDLTCRFPGCDVSAEICDIDHAVPYPAGPTHPTNLRCLCRKHHLLRTFYAGEGGWRDEQRPDGTIVWTAPGGHTYPTYPGSRMFFPDWDVTTGALPPADRAVAPSDSRSLRMPRRRQTRQADRAQRIKNRRARNDSS